MGLMRRTRYLKIESKKRDKKLLIKLQESLTKNASQKESFTNNFSLEKKA